LNSEIPSDQLDRRDETFRVQAAEFRAMLLGETRLAQLFDYIVKRSGDPRSPKEIEIALEVFGKDSTFDPSQDSTVRSHVHRLRQRLERFNIGKARPHLQIAKGEYRVTLVEAPPPADDRPGVEPAPSVSPMAKRAIIAFLVASVIVWTSVVLFAPERSAAPILAQTVIWKPFATETRPLVIAMGDFFMTAHGDETAGKVDRLVFIPEVQSRTDLSLYLSEHPEFRRKLFSRDVYRVPAVLAKAGSDILWTIASLRPRSETANMIAISQLSQKIIDTANIVNIEHFARPGVLRSAILKKSVLAPGNTPGEIKDLKSGKVFRYRPTLSSGRATPADSYGLDYGYLASYSGPSGNRILIISGIGDIAISEMVKLVADKKAIDLIEKKTFGDQGFEVLYEIRTVGDFVFDIKLLISRSL
jgi:hypothetical protein